MFHSAGTVMMPRRAAGWVCAAMCLAVLTAAQVACAQTTAAPAEGQKVQVREGDTWSAATVVRKEGRKFLIHYDGSDASSDEWVTSDRIRLPGQSGSSPVGSSPTGAPPAVAPAAPAPNPFKIGENIEFKSGPFWHKGTVINMRGRWYFIQHENSRDREWVEPWRIRTLGSKQDKYGWLDSYGIVRNGQGPPREDPGPPPLPGESTKDMLKRQADEKADASAPLTPADLSSMAELTIGPDPRTPFVPDPEPKAAHPPALNPVMLAGNPPGVFWIHIENVFITPDQSAAGLMLDAGDDRWFERVNLALGRSTGRTPLRPNSRALDLSEDGKLLATCPETQRLKHDPERLEIWNVQSSQMQHVVSFVPDEQDNGGVRSARFIGPDHILTVDRTGRLVLWDLKAKAVWSMQLPSHDDVAFSPGRRQIASWHAGSVAVIDALTGKTLRAIPTSGRECEAIAFRPDGAQVAMLAEQSLVIQDLLTGKIVQTLTPQVEHTDRLTWVSDEYLLAGNSYLIGLREQMLVWIYTKLQEAKFRRPPNARGMINPFDAPVGVASHGRFWYATLTIAGGNGKPILASTVLPDDHVRGVLSELKVASDMAIQPGATVSLEVNLPDNIKQTVDLALRSALADNGVKIAPGQPVKLVASSEQGPSREAIYFKSAFFIPMRGVAPPADAVHMNVADVTNRLAIVAADGRKLWECTEVVTPPTSMPLKKDQSIQDAVNEAMKPKQWFFIRTPIPKFVPKAAQPNGFGTSELAAEGPVPES